MLVLGLCGGLDQVSEHREHLFPPGICHDAAAALVEDGHVVAAIEEERLNRIKHSSKGAVNAIQQCLRFKGVRLSDVDRLVYYGTEEGCNAWMRNLFYGSHDAEPVVTYRQLIHDMLNSGIGEDIEDAKLCFVHHHLAHATSAFVQSGLPESLVLTIDGAGDGLSGSVSGWHGRRYEVMASFSESISLGTFYGRVIQMLGYGFTEEYKVMGLAPYGDPQRFRSDFDRLFTLLPDGGYILHWQLLESLYSLAPVRKRKQPIMQAHKDISAALQETLELIVFHILRHFRSRTGIPALCMAGGVAHNSTLNGKILCSGMFNDVFVQPASGDSGCAVGAALFPFLQPDSPTSHLASPRIRHVFWGSDVGTEDEIEIALRRWGACVRVEHTQEIVQRCADLLAAGEVIGWVQGRSEFGPRALGHRSILADPRPASNKDQINAMVKKREGYRPFAPAVLEERAADFFELPHHGTAPFMSFTLKVRAEARELLGSTTHVDNTARVQTVSRQVDPLFWELIAAFGNRTGVPVLLNTSFNNHAEPIVDSVDDAVACFLTTGLHRLVVGRYLVNKCLPTHDVLLSLAPSLPAYARLVETVATRADGQRVTDYMIGMSFNREPTRVSPRAHQILKKADGRRSLGHLLEGSTDDVADLVTELSSLWELRVIAMRGVN